MVFNSWVFAVFLAVVLGAYLVLPHRAQNALLLVASYFFYGWWDWRFLGLLFATTLVDWTVGILLGRETSQQRRRALLAASLGANLAVLGTFKYLGFFADSFARLLGHFGIHADPITLHIVLPVGISFYTFQSMSYAIDVYRRHLEPVRSLPDFMLFVSYFPQLVAGPIERAGHLLPQLREPRRVTDAQWRDGLTLILVGLVKKVAIADFLAGHVQRTFATPAAWGSLDLLLSVYAFAIQIYGDFSGYSDIARGVSKLFGIELMANFRWPYLATSVTDFWRRWHVSLSSWLRDYLYIPLGGNQRGELRTHVNLMTTMLLGGLWHGASWTFVAWGGLHGAALVVHRVFTGARVHGGAAPIRGGGSRLRRVVAIVATFHAICFAWVFFRAATFSEAAAVLSGIAALRPGIPFEALHDVVLAGGLMAAVDALTLHAEKRGLPIGGLSLIGRGLLMGALLLVLLILGDRTDVPFIYFQF